MRTPDAIEPTNTGRPSAETLRLERALSRLVNDERAPSPDELRGALRSYIASCRARGMRSPEIVAAVRQMVYNRSLPYYAESPPAALCDRAAALVHAATRECESAQ